MHEQKVEHQAIVFYPEEVLNGHQQVLGLWVNEAFSKEVPAVAVERLENDLEQKFPRGEVEVFYGNAGEIKLRLKGRFYHHRGISGVADQIKESVRRWFNIDCGCQELSTEAIERLLQ